MTIETIATQKVSQRRDSNSSNGYQESHSEDDGYFTSAVSVQHKVKYVLVHIKKSLNKSPFRHFRFHEFALFFPRNQSC